MYTGGSDEAWELGGGGGGERSYATYKPADAAHVRVRVRVRVHLSLYACVRVYVCVHE